MQLNSKRIKFLLMIILFISILSISTTVFGAQSGDFSSEGAGSALSIEDPKNHPYLYDPFLLCRNKSKGYLVINALGQIDKTRIVDYDIEDTVEELEQSIAFAYFTAGKDVEKEIKEEDEDNNVLASIQQVAWASQQFIDLPHYVQILVKDDYKNLTTSPTSEDKIQARSNQFAQFFYGIIEGGDKKIDITTETSNSKVLVDQLDQTYTVGPYKIDLKTGELKGAVSQAKEILYNELAGVNAANYPNTPEFAAYEITGIDGTDIVFLDKSGNEIKFPNWEEEFYIRFKPATGVITINPKIKIKYISKLLGKATLYKGAKATFEGELKESMIDDPIKESDFTKNKETNAAKYVKTATLKFRGVTGDTVKVKIVEDSIKDIKTEKRKTTMPSPGGHMIDVMEDFVVGFKYKAEIEDPSRLQEFVGIELEFELDGKAKILTDSVDVDLGVKKISMELGGNVWEDGFGVKTVGYDGKKVDNGDDTPYAGMQVQLFDEKNNLVATTTTDKDGKYHFYELDPLKKYYVRFTYNGQIYESTYYKNNLTGGYSNAQDEEREKFNNKFGTIDSTPENYKIGNEWHKSYALLSKLARDNGEYIENGRDENNKIKALTYQDAWNKFAELASNLGSYDNAYKELNSWLQSVGVGKTDREGVITFIKDCMITSTTLIDDPLMEGKDLVKYPVYDRFVLEDLKNPTEKVETITLDRIYSYLYTKKSDQSRYVDYGIRRREQEELYLQKDVFKATVIVNGKKHDYEYSQKDSSDDGSWSVELRASDELYNGNYRYNREIRKSEYLYDGSDSSSTDAKNLQIFVTYRIIIQNRGQSLYASVNEIVDYYDADQYSFDGTRQSNGNYTINSYNDYDENGNVTGTYVNSYVGSDLEGTKLENAKLTVSDYTSFADREKSKKLTSDGYNYNSLYITGIKSASGNDTLRYTECAYLYLTFKANIDDTTGKVKLDQDLNTGNVTIGKRNIAEINGYSTYYNPNATIPGHLNKDDSMVDVKVGNKVAGIIDTLSNAGSLEETDLTKDGDLRSSVESEVENRLEMDTDKAPNIRVVISQDDNDTRRLSGYVYEDERNVTNDKAVVGDGKYQDNETKINGVKVELVELVQNVDENGIFIGSYSGEKIWGTNLYEFQNGKLVKVDENNDRYYSGFGLSKVILKGPGILDVKEDNLGENNGEYSFKSVPAGDFFIRFTYGDNIQTVLLNNDNNEVNNLLQQKGLNVKSYNGQDYKTTTYQTEIDQSSSYNGIKGFTNYDLQNYNNGTDKSAMYYYDIDKSSNVSGASDAKDVYSFREKVNKYSVGANGKTLLNNRAEILDSFEKIGTFKYDTKEEQKQAQTDMINSLIENTKMVAQTGVIDTEVEYNRKTTENQGNENKLEYSIKDIDLGLQERPKAQLKLNKEVENFKLTLANGTTLFDTTQSVSGLPFAKHHGHKVNYNGFKLIGFTIGENSKAQPELIQAYLDEEFIAGSSIEARYSLSVENVGEIDYLDKQFYYTGKTAHKDDSSWVSKTNANTIIDYVSNLTRYEEKYQVTGTNWKVENTNNIIKSTTLKDNSVVIDKNNIDNDLVNREYFDEISTYNTLITTNSLSGDLLPEKFGKGNSSKETKLVLSALLSDSSDEDFVYNNLSEIVETSNTQGRRMAYSISGNQEMADQSLGNDTSEDYYTNIDLVEPTEIDADSSQKIVILPPLGENKNFLPIIITTLVAIIIIAAGVIIIKKRA